MSVFFTQTVALYEPLAYRHISIAVSALDIALLYWLCFKSGWFRNWLAGYWRRMKGIAENHMC
jgi:hypothetical protein